MKIYLIFFLLVILFFPSCSPKKETKQRQLILPVSVRSIDSVKIIPDVGFQYWVTIISPLPESLFAARPEFENIEGETFICYRKLATLVDDSSKRYLGAYTVSSSGTEHFRTINNKTFLLQFWRDSVSTVDTLLHL